MSRKIAGSVIALLGLLSAVAAAQRQRPRVDDADQKTLHDYVISMDKVQKIANATKDLQEVSKKHPERKDDSNPKNLDEMVQKIQSYPDAVAVLTKNGLTPREYGVGLMAVMQAGMAVGMKKSGAYKEYPPAMLNMVSQQNLDFVEQHFDEIQKLTNPKTDEH